VGDEDYGYHPNWLKYQVLRADRKKKSNIPKPVVNQASTKRQPNVGIREDKIREDKITKDNLATKNVADTVNKIIGLFKTLNPSYGRLFKNKTQRDSAERLLKKYGDKLPGMIEYAKFCLGEKYAPTITTPHELESNLAKLMAYHQKEKGQPKFINLDI